MKSLGRNIQDGGILDEGIKNEPSRVREMKSLVKYKGWVNLAKVTQQDLLLR